MLSRPTTWRMRDLALLAALACACALAVFLGIGGTFIRSMLALPLVLFAPGYALVQAASPRRQPDWAETITLSLGLSLVVCVLGGLALNETPWGLRELPEVTLLSAIVLIASAVALARRMAVLEWQAWYPSTHPDGGHRRPRWERTLRVALFTLAALLMGGAIVAATWNAQQQQTPSAVTEFWALPSTNADQKDTIRLGVNRIDPVSNEQSSSVTYYLEVIVGKKVTWLPSIHLKPNASWQSTITLPHWSSGTAPAVILLYRAGEPDQAYRQLKLWPDTSATPAAALK